MVGIVSAFTVAHSITLALAALKLVSLPSSFIEPAIAVTIMLAALDNLLPIFPVRRVVVDLLLRADPRLRLRRRAARAEPAAAQFAWALLQFNVGLEIGQIDDRGRGDSRCSWLRQPALRAVVIRGGSGVAIAVALLWFVERTGERDAAAVLSALNYNARLSTTTRARKACWL